MAHKGRVYPIKQDWRFYQGNSEGINGFPPEIALIRTEDWSTVYTEPPVDELIECSPLPWTPGDREIGYSSEIFSVTGHDLRVGFSLKIDLDGFVFWKYSCWDNDVDQIPWGWLDFPSHIPWGPGDARIIGLSPPSGATFSPHGMTESLAKRWP